MSGIRGIRYIDEQGNEVVTGGLKAVRTHKERYGEDCYRKMGSKGGRTSYGKPKGFAANPELARMAGAKGGRKSKINQETVNKMELAKEDIVDRYYNKLETSDNIGTLYGVAGSTIRYYIKKWRKEQYGLEK